MEVKPPRCLVQRLPPLPEVTNDLGELPWQQEGREH